MAPVGQHWIPVVVTFLQTIVFHGDLLPVSGSPCLTLPRPPDIHPCISYPEPTTCINGECKEVPSGTIVLQQCVCDDGWFGDSCDICCDLDCGKNGTCLLDEDGLKICQDQPWPPVSTTDAPQTSQAVKETISNCSLYEQPEISDKCFGLLPCYRGNCSAEHDVSVCVCEDGWSGTSCDLCCDLPCVNGKCFPPWDSIGLPMRCVCYSNYTGMYCEEEEPPLTAAPPVTIDVFVVAFGFLNTRQDKYETTSTDTAQKTYKPTQRLMPRLEATVFQTLYSPSPVSQSTRHRRRIKHVCNPRVEHMCGCFGSPYRLLLLMDCLQFTVKI